MIRHILATTAVSIALAVPAVAQEAEPAAEEPVVEGAEAPAADATATDPAADPAVAETDPAVVEEMPLVTVDLANVTAEELIGSDVRNNDQEKLGSIEDAKLDSEGKIEGLIVSFGGFLGFGEKTVELGMDEIEVMAYDGEPPFHAVTDLTPEALEEMPEVEG